MGRLELILGCVFAGKTEQLMSAVSRQRVVHGTDSVLAFNHNIDARYAEGGGALASHNNNSLHAHAVRAPDEIYRVIDGHSHKVYVVGIDELQFFDAGIIDLCRYLKDSGVTVIGSGLNTDFRGEPFPLAQPGGQQDQLSGKTIADLMGYATTIVTPTAICTYASSPEAPICGNAATQTQRLLHGEPAPYSDPLIVVGDATERDGRSYQARCADHHFVPRKPVVKNPFT